MNQLNIAPLVALHQSVADVIRLTNEYNALQAHCAKLSRIIAGLVAENGGFIRSEVFELINTNPEYISTEIRKLDDGFEIVIESPILTKVQPDDCPPIPTPHTEPPPLSLVIPEEESVAVS